MLTFCLNGNADLLDKCYLHGFSRFWIFRHLDFGINDLEIKNNCCFDRNRGCAPSPAKIYQIKPVRLCQPGKCTTFAQRHLFAQSAI